MPGQIFNIQDDGQLIEMEEKPFANEDLFQKLLARYPNLLAGDQILSSSPRRWLLIKREKGVPSEEGGGERWSLDHLFRDQDSVPTLVEVKRSSDTRIRREVVGQMLEYAANAVAYWPVEKMQAEYERSCEREGMDPEQRLTQFLGEDGDPDDFWQKVKTNLQAKRIRLLFVADAIPLELRRIVEFLNDVTDPVEILAVEIKHYVGQGLKTLVPRVIGQTAKKEPTGPRAVNKEARLAFWTAFCEMMKKEAPEIKSSPPTDGARMDFAVDNPDLEIRSRADCHCRPASLGVSLKIEGANAKERLKHLIQYVETNKRSLKMPWGQGRGKKGIGSFLNVVRQFDLEDEVAWPELHQWILDAVLEARTVLIPAIE